jgi:hypothetical protein
MNFTPFGMNPVKYLSGSPWDGMTRQYAVTQTVNMYANSPVFIAAGTGADPISLLKFITCVTGANPQVGTLLPAGVANGFYWTDPTGVQRYTKYWVANTPILAGTPVIADVIDDFNVIYDVQVGGGASTLANPVAGAIAANQVGYNATFGTLLNAGSTANGGSSNAFLSTDGNGNAAAPAATATFPLQILGLSSTSSYPGNAYGVNYNVVQVRFNAHQFKAGTLGAI